MARAAKITNTLYFYQFFIRALYHSTTLIVTYLSSIISIVGNSTVGVIRLFDYQKSSIRLIMKSAKPLIRKNLMERINHTTQLIGIKDKNITLDKAIQHNTHIEAIATLDYHLPKCKHCRGKQIKYGFQKPYKIPLLEQTRLPTLLRLKKRQFQCKSCQRVVVSETEVVERNCQIQIALVKNSQPIF